VRVNWHAETLDESDMMDMLLIAESIGVDATLVMITRATIRGHLMLGEREEALWDDTRDEIDVERPVKRVDTLMVCMSTMRAYLPLKLWHGLVVHELHEPACRPTVLPF
jgi:hypothetical protein